MSFQAQGMRAWLFQRLTALYIAIYLVVLLGWIVVQHPLSYSNWQSLFSLTLVQVLTVLFYFSVFIHAWVGIRDVLVDYVKPIAIRFTLLSGLFGLLAFMSVWLLLIVFNMVNQ